MTSKERVRMAIEHRSPDRVPANFEATPLIWGALMKRYAVSEREEIYQRLEIDYREIFPDYIGPKLQDYRKDGVRYHAEPHGFLVKEQWTGKEYNGIVANYPFDENTTVEEIEQFDWINPDWFDYESVKRQCGEHPNQALIFGHEGPFQISTFLMKMEDLFVKMAIEPEVAHRLFDRFVQFELEYYERILIAGDGQLDILRPHDDYGTQRGLLFGLEMWRDYFAENTKKLTDLAHRYGCFYQQHSCGAISELIPELINCGVDIVDPIQPVLGMEPELLKEKYGSRIAFQGGIDTQNLLPFGSFDEVKKEAGHLMEVLGKDGGYILMASQAFEGDVPAENVEAVYQVPRN